MRPKLLTLFIVTGIAFGFAGAATAANPYQEAAQRYAAALLEYGRDHYGPIHTPMFVHTIDLRTLEIPQQRTPAEWRAEMSTWKEDRNYLMWGKDRSSMAWAQDSNLLWDTETIRLFYALSRDIGDPRFAQAADDYIAYFLKHCVSRTTGFFAWGEHIAYNVLDDQIHGKRHELQHPAPLWEEMWKFNPDAVRNEIEAVYLYHITDKRIMAYDRHANYWNGMPERDQATIMGYAGTYAQAFAFLYGKTGDTQYLDWGRKLFLAFQSKSNDEGLYPDNWTDRQARDMPYMFTVNTSIALSMYQLYESTHDDRWLDDANQYLDACFRRIARTLENSPNPFSTSYQGDVIGAPRDFIEAALKAYHWTADDHYLAMARQVGTAWEKTPQPKAQMASVLAERINAFASLFEATGEKRWLLAARDSGDYALRAFVHPSGLIRGTAIVDRPDYYDNIQGPGALALALYRLGNLHEGLAPLKPVDKTGDVQPPQISDWKFPEEASNAEAVAVSVRIADPSGIKRSVLNYTYGNEVGFEDANPEIKGDFFMFHIAPPGVNFIGEVSFAVEAVDASSNQNRTISRWRRLKLASEAQAENAYGQWLYPTLGLALHGVPPGAAVRASVTRWLPPGTAAPEKGWVSAGRYITFDETVHTGLLRVAYAPEETWRLIESTLVLAFWNGHAWVRVPSELDTTQRTVSARNPAARCWTLLGEDRVLWWAPGRETGAALADLEGNGTFDVVTTNWQPGELLTARGQSLQQFPIDPPYHPITNFSAPAVARLTPGEEPLLLFGAPSGYVYAYDRSGKLHWRCEVGGEILGAIAVGKLGAGPNLDVVASWSGGVAVIDAAGHKRWQKQFPEPSGQTPVLVDLEGRGRLDIVLNVASKLVALAGDDGRVLWEFTAPAESLITPAAGEFTRGGRPRIVTGDDTGVVYALDEAGKLLWRQDRIFGPREVPEPIDAYAGIAEVGLADLAGRGERQVIVTTKSGETVALGARGERLWRFASYERKVGISLGLGAHLAFADLDGDGKLEVILSQQDSYVYVLDSEGRQKWCYLGYFWYHTQPAVADLEHTGELDIVFTAPEENGTYALRSGYHGKPGGAPWPMTRGSLARTNCAPW
ncbi:MAG: PQQ-binding-like beta-propeller repeat protein [Terriglobia bacterium]|jgi:outer membrane protein assembly factor BamB